MIISHGGTVISISAIDQEAQSKTEIVVAVFYLSSVPRSHIVQ